MEIKIECPCGQPFEFDVEPENDRMPCEIQCPACGADATAQANVLISQQLLQKPTDQPRPAPPAPMRVNRPFAAAAPALVAPSRMAPLPARVASKPSQPRDNSFLKGMVGALVAGIVGMIGWFLLIKATGVEIGYAAWGVGAITGLGARLVGGEGGAKLGLTAGLFALIAIVGGQVLATKSIEEGKLNKILADRYQAEVDFAKNVLAANTVDETKALIAGHDKVDVSQVTDEQVEKFKESELPDLRNLAAGKPSQAEYIDNINTSLKPFTHTFHMLFVLLQDSFSLFTLLWIFLGVSSAYKIGSGRNQ